MPSLSMYSHRCLLGLLTVLSLLNPLAGCSTVHVNNPGSEMSWTHTAIFLSNDRIVKLKQRIASKTEPNFSAWLNVKKNCDNGLLQAPHPVEKWAIPGFYDGHKEHEEAVERLRQDSTLAYEEALCFRILDDTNFAKQSARIINSWAVTLKEADSSLTDTKLSINEFFPPMIVAADLLDRSEDWSLEQKTRFKKFIRDIILPLNTMEPKSNNQANWGVFLVLCAAAYIDDSALFEKAEARMKSLMDVQIGSDGTMLFEFDRSDNKNWHGGPTKGKNGIWYSSYALLPMTLAAEVLGLNDRNIFDYQTTSGRSIRLAFEKIAIWDRHPEYFPFYKSNHGHLKGVNAVSYFEILNQHWQNENATELLNEFRPLTSSAGMPDITLTHGGF
jgi:hypothetical protein